MAGRPVSLTRRVRFCAAHVYHAPSLDAEENRRVFGKCNRPHGHGHNYAVEVTVTGPVDPVTGMVVDLAWLDRLLVEQIVEPFDHTFLNRDVDVFARVVPTTENLALEIWRRLDEPLREGDRRLTRVRVLEDDTLWAEVGGEVVAP